MKTATKLTIPPIKGYKGLAVAGDIEGVQFVLLAASRPELFEIWTRLMGTQTPLQMAGVHNSILISADDLPSQAQVALVAADLILTAE